MENTSPQYLPSLPSAKDWKRQTDSKFLGFSKPRSQLLKALDTALKEYEKVCKLSQSIPSTDQLHQRAKHAFDTVDGCFKKWESERYLRTTGSEASVEYDERRNSKGAVRALQDSLKSGRERFGQNAPTVPSGLGATTRNSVAFLRATKSEPALGSAAHNNEAVSKSQQRRGDLRHAVSGGSSAAQPSTSVKPQRRSGIAVMLRNALSRNGRNAREPKFDMVPPPPAPSQSHPRLEPRRLEVTQEAQRRPGVLKRSRVESLPTRGRGTKIFRGR